jgi:uncharacterized protein (TIGR00266 family)
MSALEFEIQERPEYSILLLNMQAGQKVYAEPGSMAWMSPKIEMKTGLSGGFKRTLGRAFGGESLLLNTYNANGAGELALVAGQPGDTIHYKMDGIDLMLSRGAFLARGEGVDVTGSWQGARGFFGGEGLVMLKAMGRGDLFFQSYGGILEIDVRDEYFVDSGYIAAFESTLDYRVTTMPGLSTGRKIKTFLFGGEMLVTRFSGQGKLWIQSRSVTPYLDWIQQFRPVERSSSSNVFVGKD